MKILIDMTFISPKTIKFSIPIVVCRILRGIPLETRREFKLLIDTGCFDFLHKMFPDYEYVMVDVYNMRKIYYDPRLLFCPFNLRNAINNSGCDAVFFPCDGNRYGFFKFKIPSIVMIHDLKWLKSDTQSKKKGIRSFLMGFYGGKRKYERTIGRAASIITISEFTKSDLLSFFPETPKEKVHVVYNAVPLIDEIKKPQNINKGDRYILNVNTLLEFKNPLTLLKAFCLITDKYKGKLVFVSRLTDYWHEVLEPYILENKLDEKVVRLENLEESELRYLYENAELFVTPSLHEGFGLTPVEAAIYCCPVVSSRSESLPEATMGLVKYYEPAKDDKVLAKVMLDMLDNPLKIGTRKEIAEKMKERYSTENQLKGLLTVFRNM